MVKVAIRVMYCLVDVGVMNYCLKSSIGRIKDRTGLLVCLGALCFVQYSIGQEELDFNVKERAMEFMMAKNKWQQPEGSVDDIDYLLSFFADEFVDDHVKFNVVVTDKNELRNGMIRKLETKVYYSNITITGVLAGKNVVFLKYVERAKIHPTHLENVLEYEGTHMMSFEFDKNGKITHLRRLHDQ